MKRRMNSGIRGIIIRACLAIVFFGGSVWIKSVCTDCLTVVAYAAEPTFSSGTTGVVRGSDGNWYYVVNGEIQNVNSVEQNQNGWWVIENGKVNFNFTGLAENRNGIWYCVAGKVDFSKTDVMQCYSKVTGTTAWWNIVEGKLQNLNTVAKNSNGWWVIRNGQVAFDYNGIAPNDKGFWYCVGGKVNFDYNGYAALYSGGPTYKISGGQADISSLTSTTNLIHVSCPGYDHWFYAPNGKVNYTFSGSSSNQNGIWRVCDGCVDFSFNDYLRYYKTSSSELANKVAYFSGGKLDTSWTKVSRWLTFTDLSKFSSEINGYVYVKNGYQDLATQAVSQGEYFYYMIQGTCNPQNSNQSGYILRTVNLQNRLFYSGRSLISTGGSYRGVKCANGDTICVRDNVFQSSFSGAVGNYYFRNGVLDTSFTGLAKDVANNGRYNYYSSGLLDTDYTGLCVAEINGDYGPWYVENGHISERPLVLKLEKSNIYRYIENGKVNSTYKGFIYASIDGRVGYYYFEKGVWKSELSDILTYDNSEECNLIDVYSNTNCSMPEGLNGTNSYLVEKGRLGDIQSLDSYYYNQLDTRQQTVYKRIDMAYKEGITRAVRKNRDFVELQAGDAEGFVYQANSMTYIGADEKIENIAGNPFVTFANPIGAGASLSAEEMQDTMKAYIYDHPENSLFNQRMHYSDLTFWLAGIANENENDQGVDDTILTDMLKEIHNGKQNQNDHDKIMDIYEYIEQHGVYAYALLNQDEMNMNNTEGLYICSIQDNAYEFADDYKAVCTGFAQAFSYFCRCDGIECIAVIGLAENGGRHAWNMIYLDGQWYMVDPTAAVCNKGMFEWDENNYTQKVKNSAGEGYTFTYPEKTAN